MVNLALYRKAIVLASVAVAAAGSAWTAQGWRMGKRLAETKAAHTQAEVRRTHVVVEDWHRASLDAARMVMESKAKLQAERLANADLLKRLRASQPQEATLSCRLLPLPDTYLENFRQ